MIRPIFTMIALNDPFIHKQVFHLLCKLGYQASLLFWFLIKSQFCFKQTFFLIVGREVEDGQRRSSDERIIGGARRQEAGPWIWFRTQNWSGQFWKKKWFLIYVLTLELYFYTLVTVVKSLFGIRKLEVVSLKKINSLNRYWRYLNIL